MMYDHIRKATFINRPNRFIADILIDDKREVCHVKNTGRCKELLTEHPEIYVQEMKNRTRKTKYDLISVIKGNRIVNIDSQAPKSFRLRPVFLRFDSYLACPASA
jgi:sugar fermentation stimulation protein A